MLRQNIDFIAVFFIAAGLLAFPKVAAFQLTPIRLQNAIQVQSCPLQADILSSIERALNK
jgi:hypothetical protein